MPKTYSDEFRAQAYLALLTAGYPKRGVLVKVAKTLDLPEHTLKRWAKERPFQRTKFLQSNLQEVMLGEVYRIVSMLSEKRQHADYRQLTASLAALLGEVRELSTLPPELIACGPVLNNIMSIIRELNWNPHKFFSELEIEIIGERDRLKHNLPRPTSAPTDHT
jgi:transposase-like protein